MGKWDERPWVHRAKLNITHRCLVRQTDAYLSSVYS